jgi:hypothetical protein
MLAPAITAEDIIRAANHFPSFLPYCYIRDKRGNNPMELWKFQLETAEAWGLGVSEIVLKSRQLGYTWLLADYACWKIFQPGATVLIISKGEREAINLGRRIKYVYNNLPPEITYHRPIDQKQNNLLEFALVGGGELVILPSTEDAGRSFSAATVLLDEAAFHPYAEANYSAYYPTVADGGQLIVVSTANGPSGFFYDFWQGAVEDEDEDRFLHPRFIPWNARPGRDEAWLRRQLKAFKKLPHFFKQEFPSNAEEAFVLPEGLVFQDFNPDIHMSEYQWQSAPAWEACKMRVASVDFGGADPTGIVPWGVDDRGHIWQYGEFLKTYATTEDIIGYLERFHERAPFHHVWGDQSQGVALMDLRAAGYPASKAEKARGHGMGLLSWILRNNRLHINPDCKQTRRQYVTYRLRKAKDPNTKEQFLTSTPYDHHGDLMDCSRYNASGIMTLEMATGGFGQAVYSGVGF